MCACIYVFLSIRICTYKICISFKVCMYILIDRKLISSTYPVVYAFIRWAGLDAERDWVSVKRVLVTVDESFGVAFASRTRALAILVIAYIYTYIYIYVCTYLIATTVRASTYIHTISRPCKMSCIRRKAAHQQEQQLNCNNKQQQQQTTTTTTTTTTSQSCTRPPPASTSAPPECVCTCLLF